ncbi:MAG TPA: DUF1684 domain-containing protein [Mycobacteriales bacterium]|nr:DUF1684 domain-containing protein [Mycobacteriales bacterium]
MSLQVLDWRRQVFGLYRDVRAEPDPVAAHEMWCERRQQLFRAHPASANRRAVLRHAAYDPALRFDVALDTAVAPQRIEVATGTDGIVPFERIGRVGLDGIGVLDVWWLASYGGGVWLPLRDPNPDTYGGGRYVLDTVKGADLGGRDGRLVVDLNFAYNPSCAYDEAWACPLAPPGNVLEVEVTGGELLPG